MAVANVHSSKALKVGDLTTFDPSDLKITIDPSKKSQEINLAIDTEYLARLDSNNQYINVTVATRYSTKTLFLEHPKLGLNLAPTWEGECALKTILGAKRDYEGIVKEEQSGIKLLIVNIFYYYAPGDLECFLGYRLARDVVMNLERRGNTRIKRNKNKFQSNIKLDYYLTIGSETYQIAVNPIDLSAIGEKGSLRSLAEQLGVLMPQKSLMDADKRDMPTAYKNNPEDFIEYAAGDARVLFKVWDASEKLRNEIYATVGLNSQSNPEMTQGERVAKLLMSWLDDHMGLPDEDINLPDEKRTEVCHFAADANVNSLRQKQTTAKYAALVHGGRAKNERPMKYKAEGVIADVDGSGFYSRSLLHLHYPVGIPTIVHDGKGRKKQLTLETFLKEYKGELVPGCWFAVVSGKLSFDQNIICSKDADDDDDFSLTDGDDIANINAPFGIFTREIKNGVINHDILQILQSRASSKEWAELKTLRLETAIVYQKQHQCQTPQEWREHIKGELESDRYDIQVVTDKRTGTEEVKDHRTRAWYAAPLRDLVEPLMEKRTHYKDLRKGADQSTAEWALYNGRQLSFKSTINTIYGVLASPHKKISNVCVANNITAKARATMWMMSTAVHGYQSITDGCQYNLNDIRLIPERKPSLDVTARFNRPHLLDRREKSRFKTGSLGGHHWYFKRVEGGKTVLQHGEVEVVGTKEAWHYIDKQFKKHLYTFFGNSGIDIIDQDIFDFEHKDVYKELLTHGQADYQFVGFDNELKTKARGHKEDLEAWSLDGEVLDTSKKGIFNLFNQLRQGGKITPIQVHREPHLLQINEWHAIWESRTPNIIKQTEQLPGTIISRDVKFRPISIAQFSFRTIDQRKSWETYNEKLKLKYGWGIEMFFYDQESTTLDYETALVTIQIAIDEDQEWICKKSTLRQDKFTHFPLQLTDGLTNKQRMAKRMWDFEE
jgi:hypothetical protein